MGVHMRRGLLLTCLLGIFVLDFSNVIEAQFQEPSKEELQMTRDLKAPGADAIYLYMEETTDDATHLKFLHERIKVLTEKGREESSVVSISYVSGLSEVVEVEARTIHSDGTVIPMTVKPDDIVAVRLGKLQVNKFVITFPSVEVGSILEYRARIRNPKDLNSLPKWDIQQAYPVRRAHYSFHPSKKYGKTYEGETQLSYGWSLPEKSELKYDRKTNTYTLDLNDIPSLPKEAWMPPLNTLKYRVDFYLVDSAYSSDSSYWAQIGIAWGSAVDEVVKPTGELKKAAASLVAPGDSVEQKARKLYNAVQQLDNTDFSRTKSKAELKKLHQKEIRQVEDVWKQKRGDGDEIALLFIALAKALNLPVYAALVIDRSRSMFDKHYLSLDQFDDLIAILDLDDREVFLDPGEKMCPFGLLDWKHAFSSGLRTGRSLGIFRTPAATYEESVEQRTSEIYLDRNGSAKGTVRFEMTGNLALHWRQLALENDPEELKKQFNEDVLASLPAGIRCEVDRFMALEDPASKLTAILNISGDLGTLTGKRLLIPGLLFQAKAKYPFVSENQRLTPVDVHFPIREEDRITYHLPQGFQVETLPSAAHVVWQDHATLKTAFAFPPQTINVFRAFVYNYTVLSPDSYSELQNFYRKVAAADQEQLVLSPSGDK
jgi:hypothetical protein